MLLPHITRDHISIEVVRLCTGIAAGWCGVCPSLSLNLNLLWWFMDYKKIISLVTVVPSSSSSSCYFFMAFWMVGWFRNFYSAQARRRIFKSE
jgi:hypothetical protein